MRSLKKALTEAGQGAQVSSRPRSRHWRPSLAALATLIAAISCCLPVLSLTLAAGFAGLGAVLWSSRPYLLAAALLFIAYGFYQVVRAKKCRRRPSVAASILLWLSALLVAVSIFFPQLMANIMANLTMR